MARIVVYVRGGVVQGIVADESGVEAMIVNYDDEEESQTLEREFMRVASDPELVARTEAGTE